MKNQISRIVAILTLSLLGSCNSEIKKQVNEDAVDYLQVGIDHNEGLRKMFVDLKEKKDAELTFNGAIKSFKQSVYETTIENHPEINSDHMSPLFNKVDDLLLFYANKSTRVSESGMELHDFILNEIEDDLTDQQNSYLSRIVGVMTTGDSDLEVMNESFNQLEDEVRSVVSTEDMHVLLNAIYVGRASAQYWHDNYDTWVSEFASVDGGRLSGDIDWGRAGAADLTAVVSVGLMTSSILIVPFIGWGTWAAITGGGAAILSGASVVFDIIK